MHKKNRKNKLRSKRITQLALVIITTILAAGMTVALSGCSEEKSVRHITDVNELDGQRIGVAVGWTSDYLLTGRDDVTILRYNTVADMITALCYRRVDAITVEQPMVYEVMGTLDGVRCLDEPLDSDGIGALVSPKREDVLKELNEFIEDFYGTDIHRDIQKRGNSLSRFQPKEVPSVESDKVLKLCVEDWYPFSYYDNQTDEFVGIEVEIIKWFAYEYGYDLQIYEGTWNSMRMGVSRDKYDLGTGVVSDVYRSDFERAGTCLMSDTYFEMNILLIEIEDPKELAVKTVLDW